MQVYNIVPNKGKPFTTKSLDPFEYFPISFDKEQIYKYISFFFNKHVLHNTLFIYKLFLHFISRVVRVFLLLPFPSQGQFSFCHCEDKNRLFWK